MTTASDFFNQFKSRSPGAWESAALELAKAGDVVRWPLVPVTVKDFDHTLTFFVTSDYFAVGSPQDPFRIPLTPLTAQKIADVLGGSLLPTPKMVKTIHEQASTKLEPEPQSSNKGPNLEQYQAHNGNVQAALRVVQDAAGPGLVSGHKKDVVLGNLLRPGKVLIYGWMRGNVPAGVDATPMATASWRVQPYSSVHGDSYVDYSHGIRLVSPNAKLDGKDVKLASVLQDPKLSALVSDEGPLKTLRYPVPLQAPSVPFTPTVAARPRLVDEGLSWVMARTSEARGLG